MAPSTHSTNKAALSALLCLSLFGAPALLHAQTKKPSKADYKKAEALFNEAELLYKAGIYEQALDKYKQAYLLSQESGLLFNMAQCYRYMNQKEEALKTYKYFLEENPKVSFRAEVEGIIAELERPEPVKQPDPVKEPAIAPSSEPTKQPEPVKEPEPTTQKNTPMTQEAPRPQTKQEGTPKQQFSRKSKQLFIISGTMALASVGLGASALASAQAALDTSNVQAPALPDPNEIKVHKFKATLRAGLSDSFLAGAFACAGIALLAPREAVSISISPTFTGATLQGHF